MFTHHSRSAPYPLHGANEVRLLVKALEAVARCFRQAGLAGLEQAKAPAPPPPRFLHSPTAQSPPLRTSPSFRFFHPCSRLCFSAPQLPRCLAWGDVGGGFPPTAFVPCQGLRSGRQGCREMMWVNNLRPGESSCHLCLPPAVLELDAVYCGAPQLCRVSKKSFPKLPEGVGPAFEIIESCACEAMPTNTLLLYHFHFSEQPCGGRHWYLHITDK